MDPERKPGENSVFAPVPNDTQPPQLASDVAKALEYLAPSFHEPIQRSWQTLRNGYKVVEAMGTSFWPSCLARCLSARCFPARTFSS